MPEIQLPDFITNIDWSEKRNKVASVLAGGLFFSGWWFALDASISHHADTLDVFHLCGVFSTISMIMVNSVSNSVIRGESFTEGVLGVGGARIWFFVGFLMGFASFIGNNTFKNVWKDLDLAQDDIFQEAVTFFLANISTIQIMMDLTPRRGIQDLLSSCRTSVFLSRAFFTNLEERRICGAK